MPAVATAVREYHGFAANHRKKAYTVAMDATYPADGEDIDLTAEFATVDSAYIAGDPVVAARLFVAHAGTVAGHVMVKAYDNALAELASGTDVSGATALKLIVEGVPLGGVASDPS